uniref:Uncharacterized protein n=2 Tax=Stomoxys calcitrans TaxID=35570 RepID=A0A1I8QDI5_STOCA
MPYFSSNFGDLKDSNELFYVNVIEYQNNADVKAEPVKQRSCKFPEERDPGSPWHYSYSSCMSYLGIQFEIKMCNCTLFTSPEIFKSQYCDIMGMDCIAKAFIVKLVNQYSVDNDACCPSCVEAKIINVGVITNAEASLEVNVINVPSERYKRVVTKNSLDLVVAVGGVIGLFAGASILNLFEIVYVLLRRKIN